MRIFLRAVIIPKRIKDFMKNKSVKSRLTIIVTLLGCFLAAFLIWLIVGYIDIAAAVNV